MKVAFYTLGCKVNQYETQAMLAMLEQAGFCPCEISDGPDVIVLNSCTVTAESDRKTRQALRKLRRSHPQCALVLTGCMPQAFAEQAAALPQADIVMGNANNPKLPALLERYFMTRQRIVDIEPHTKEERFAQTPISTFHERTRAFVKIEDGCNRFCSYCIIPYARGRVRSRPLEDLSAELKALAASGFREVVLVGINLSAYGSDLGINLCDAVETACDTQGIERVRLGSMEPDQLTREMIERLAKFHKLCPQFHLSLQSGCNATLKRMRRHYDTAFYRQLVSTLRGQFPNCAITTDVMVGFPGEDEEEFQTSRQFVEEIGFAKTHVFVYSRRSGTPAAEMPNQISAAVKEQRSRQMIATAQECTNRFLLSQVGQTCPVLLESRQGDGMVFGYTPNYSPVAVPGGKEEICGKLLQVTITAVANGQCEGVLA